MRHMAIEVRTVPPAGPFAFGHPFLFTSPHGGVNVTLVGESRVP